MDAMEGRPSAWGRTHAGAATPAGSATPLASACAEVGQLADRLATAGELATRVLERLTGTTQSAPRAKQDVVPGLVGTLHRDLSRANEELDDLTRVLQALDGVV